MERLKVTHFTRQPHRGQFSIENVFDAVRRSFDGSVDCSVARCPFAGGIFGRIANLGYAFFRRGEVNHITGDVHYLAFALPGRNTILTVHDAAGLARMHGWRRKIYQYVWFNGPAARVRLVTAISEATKRALIEEVGVSGAKIAVVPDCISTAFQPAAPPGAGRRRVLLQIGTKRNKNVVRLAAALAGLSCDLEIVGVLNAEQIAALEENRISYRSSSNLTEAELIAKYRDTDALVFVSTIEGFGMPIIEAQTVGRPVVTSNSSSMPEVAGDAACYVDPYSVESIREGVLRVLNDTAYRDELVRKGFANAERFSPARVAEAYLQLYRQVAACENPPLQTGK